MDYKYEIGDTVVIGPSGSHPHTIENRAESGHQGGESFPWYELKGAGWQMESSLFPFIPYDFDVGDPVWIGDEDTTVHIIQARYPCCGGKDPLYVVNGHAYEQSCLRHIALDGNPVRIELTVKTEGLTKDEADAKVASFKERLREILAKAGIGEESYTITDRTDI